MKNWTTVFAAVLLCCPFIRSAEGAEKIRIAVTNYNITYLAAAVAAKKGFFREEGFDPEIIVGQGQCLDLRSGERAHRLHDGV